MRIHVMPILETTSDSGCATAFGSPNVSISLTHKAPVTPGPWRFPPMSPGAGGSAGDRVQGSGRKVRLEAADPVLADDGIVGVPSRQIEPVTDTKLDGLGPIGKPEHDRARRDDDHLVVTVVVGRVSVIRTVGPTGGLQARSSETLGRVGHVR
jgi:hypothetical protein